MGVAMHDMGVGVGSGVAIGVALAFAFSGKRCKKDAA
jgi:hypothetical protein